MLKPVLFIGSSSEALKIARAIRSDLEKRGIQVTLWTDGVFNLGVTYGESLTDTAEKFDFAALVLAPDDIVVSKGTQYSAPRDNVLFELGLFMGALGRERTFCVLDESAQAKVPSDLEGVKMATYSRHEDGNLAASVGRACDELANAMEGLGPIHHPKLDPKISSIVKHFRLASRIEDELFQEQLERWSARFEDESKLWGCGVLTLRSGHSFFLATIYERASQSIFSTSIPDYNRIVWGKHLSQKLLAKQRANSNAKSTRIFIYSRPENVGEADLEIMRLHRDHNVQVLLFFNEGVGSFDCDPATPECDWTYVDDGLIIGVTQHLGKNQEAKWYFNNKEKREYYKNLQHELLEFAEPLEDFIRTK
jgi:predicted nucleotide-binding protein